VSQLEYVIEHGAEDEHAVNMACIALFYLWWSIQAFGDQSPNSTIRVLIRRAVTHPLIEPHPFHVNSKLSKYGVATLSRGLRH
jgi:hypothetical protein